MAQVLPAPVEELNMRVPGNPDVNMMFKRKAAFDGKLPGIKLKREISLPNGVENWNIGNLEPYLNFDDFTDIDFCQSPDDRTVPGGDQRGRCESISSTSSFVEEKPSLMYNPLKNFNSFLHMGSGSTIAIDHSYHNSSSSPSKGLDMEETYANIDIFFGDEGTDLKTSEPLLPSFSPLPSTSNDDIFEFPSKSLSSEESMESLTFRSPKRPRERSSEDDVFFKQPKTDSTESYGSNSYQEVRRKNNIASKNCRKTRKEKQKEMEEKVSKLEEERENLKAKIHLLEQSIEAHKKCFFSAIGVKSS